MKSVPLLTRRKTKHFSSRPKQSINYGFSKQSISEYKHNDVASTLSARDFKGGADYVVTKKSAEV